jgi:hypothetical protein
VQNNFAPPIPSSCSLGRALALSLISRVENQRGRLLAGVHSCRVCFWPVIGSIVAPIVGWISLCSAAAVAASVDVINLGGVTGGVADRERAAASVRTRPPVPPACTAARAQRLPRPLRQRAGRRGSPEGGPLLFWERSARFHSN